MVRLDFRLATDAAVLIYFCHCVVLVFQMSEKHWKVLLKWKEYSDFGVALAQVYFVTCHFLEFIGWSTSRWKHITTSKCPHFGLVFLAELFQEVYVFEYSTNHTNSQSWWKCIISFADSGVYNCSIRCCQNASTNWIWRKGFVRRASGEIITETSYSWHFEENLRSKWFAGYFCGRNATYSENCTRMRHHDNIIWIRQSVFLPAKCYQTIGRARICMTAGLNCISIKYIFIIVLIYGKTVYIGASITKIKEKIAEDCK